MGLAFNLSVPFWNLSCVIRRKTICRRHWRAMALHKVNSLNFQKLYAWSNFSAWREMVELLRASSGVCGFFHT